MVRKLEKQKASVDNVNGLASADLAPKYQVRINTNNTGNTEKQILNLFLFHRIFAGWSFTISLPKIRFLPAFTQRPGIVNLSVLSLTKDT